jgi:hypothetical protein
MTRHVWNRTISSIMMVSLSEGPALVSCHKQSIAHVDVLCSVDVERASSWDVVF